jgi:putative hydrolase of the HAD superfamily
MTTLRRMASRTLVVFDGDDTLWATETLYDRARQRIRNMLCSVGIDGARWELVERKIDLERVATQGFSWHRFPRSCLLALREVEPRTTRPTRWPIEFAIFLVALRVYFECPSLMPDVKDVLREAARSCNLVLLTKGEPWIQRRRIRQSGLRRYFERCVIVRDKTPETFAATAALPTGQRLTISVGNSLASDIEPALSTGFVGVHVDGYMWEHERRKSKVGTTCVITVPNLRGALEAVRHISETGCASFPV